MRMLFIFFLRLFDGMQLYLIEFEFLRYNSLNVGENENSCRFFVRNEYEILDDMKMTIKISKASISIETMKDPYCFVKTQFNKRQVQFN